MTNKLTIIPIIAILVLLLTVSFASAVSPDPEEVICYWPLENTTDTSGNGYTLTNVGGYTGYTGILDDGYGFLGLDWMTSEVSLNEKSSMSISAWIYMTTFVDNAGIIVSRGAWLHGILIGDLSNDNDPRIVYSSHTTEGYMVQYSEIISTNTWYHVVMTYDGSSVSFYLNGTMVICDSDIDGNGDAVCQLGETCCTINIDGEIQCLNDYTKAVFVKRLEYDE